MRLARFQPETGANKIVFVHPRASLIDSLHSIALPWRVANYTKREKGRAEMLRLLEAGLKPRLALPPCEVCGAPPVVGAYTFTRAFHFCEAHRAEADKVFGHGVE